MPQPNSSDAASAAIGRARANELRREAETLVPLLVGELLPLLVGRIRAEIWPSPLAPLTITIREAASLIDQSPDATYALVRSGEIPSHRVGRSIRICRDNLEAWISRRAKNAAGNEARHDLIRREARSIGLRVDVLDPIERRAAEPFPLPPPGSEYLTPSEAAGAMEIGRTQLFELLASGELPSERAGRARRIRRDHLYQYQRMRQLQAESEIRRQHLLLGWPEPAKAWS